MQVHPDQLHLRVSVKLKKSKQNIIYWVHCNGPSLKSNFMKTSIFLVGLIFFVLTCTNNESVETAYQYKNFNQQQELNLTDDSSDGRSKIGNRKLNNKITFKQIKSYESTEEVVIGEVADFAVDDKDRVFIADMDQTTIHVFESDGSYKTTLGRQGSGPAEFETVSPNTTITAYSNELYVTDYSGEGSFFPSRVQVFDLEEGLSFSRTIKLIPRNRNEYAELKGYYPHQIYPRQNDNFLVTYRQPPHAYKDSTSYIR